MSTVYAWLDERRPVAPAQLLARVRRALPDDGAASDTYPDIQTSLGDAAVSSLARALEGGSAREAGLDLLAADALLTYGCEAAAEQGVSAVIEFAKRYGATRLATLH